MRKFRYLVLGGIGNKILNLILAAVILTAGVFMAVSTYQSRTLSGLAAETNVRQKEAISAITDDIMNQVVNDNMTRFTTLEAMIYDEMFRGLQTRVEMLADFAERIYENPQLYGPMPFSGPDPERHGEVTAQVFYAENTSGNLDERFGLAANMSDLMISLYGASDLTNSCFIGLPEGGFLIVDDRSGVKFQADGTVKSYDPRTRPWYTQALREGGLIFTDVETDAFTGDIGIVCAKPVYVNGKLQAVVGSDLFLSSMQEAVQASEENGGFVCVVNSQGHITFSPMNEGSFAVVGKGRATDLRQSENRELGEIVRTAMMQETGVRKAEVNGKNYFIAGAPLATVGWAMLSVFDEEQISQPSALLQESYEQIEKDAVGVYRGKSAKSRQTIIILMLFVILIISMTAIQLGRRIVSPLNMMVKRMAALKEGNLEFKMEDIYRTGDEVEELASSFASLSHKTVQYVEEVKKITAEKERIGSELSMARRIQAAMLPGIFPPYPDRSEFDIYAVMDPAKEVGGDFYDFFLIDDDHLCMVMADVSGKGVPAALFMMASKIIIQSCAMLGVSAGQILTKANEAISSNNQEEMFVTVWLGILQISTGKITAANAGHEYPVLMKAGGQFELVKDRHGFVIGGMAGMKYREYELQLEPGAKLFVYTDGVPEATDAEQKMFGTDRMLAALNEDTGAEPRQILQNVRKAVDAFVKDAEQFDDITMLCMEYRGMEVMKKETDRNTMTVAADVSHLAAVQKFIEEKLMEADASMKAVTQTGIAVEEVFVNIAQYAYAPRTGMVEIHVEIDEEARMACITFRDEGVPYNPLAKEDPDITLPAGEREVGGLGIFMTKKLMDDVSYEFKDRQNVLTLKKKI
ncbi:MAG: SpoIIE family protein phosphatase [Solobacterium sp.]|nr:SpoIIE family protein phosphatase [Solobacterium sp.]